MCQAFAPVLARNRGGALVNMCSIISFFNRPSIGSCLCFQGRPVVDHQRGIRIELRPQGTLVLGVHAGFIDTRLTDAPPFPHRDRCGPPRRRHQRSRLNGLSDEAPPLCSLPNSPGDAGGRPLLPPLSRGSSPTAPPLHSCFRGRTGVSTPTTLTLLCAGSRLRTAHGRRPRPPCASVRLVRLRTIASLLAPAGCARSLWRQSTSPSTAAARRYFRPGASADGRLCFARDATARPPALRDDQRSAGGLVEARGLGRRRERTWVVPDYAHYGGG